MKIVKIQRAKIISGSNHAYARCALRCVRSHSRSIWNMANLTPL